MIGLPFVDIVEFHFISPQVCLLAASNVTKSGLGRVLFLDTGNSFSPTRVAQFVSSSSELADTEVRYILHWHLVFALPVHAALSQF